MYREEGRTRKGSALLMFREKNMQKKNNPRWKNGTRRKYRARFKAMGLPCAICGRPIHYDEPSDGKHPLSFVIDEKRPVSRWKEFGYDSPEAAALDWDNLQPCHYACNGWKSSRTMEEIKKTNELKKTNEFGENRKTKRALNLPDGDW